MVNALKTSIECNLPVGGELKTAVGFMAAEDKGVSVSICFDLKPMQLYNLSFG